MIIVLFLIFSLYNEIADSNSRPPPNILQKYSIHFIMGKCKISIHIHLTRDIVWQ
jgi:hypothetical protein